MKNALESAANFQRSAPAPDIAPPEHRPRSRELFKGSPQSVEEAPSPEESEGDGSRESEAFSFSRMESAHIL